MAFKILVRLSESYVRQDRLPGGLPVVARGERYVTGKTFRVKPGRAPLPILRTLLRAAQRATK